MSEWEKAAILIPQPTGLWEKMLIGGTLRNTTDSSMKIESIKLRCDGYVTCRSYFCTYFSSISSKFVYSFTKGVNRLEGEVDEEFWPASYLIGMKSARPKDFMTFEDVDVSINEQKYPFTELEKYACYMDTLYPAFSSRKSVRRLVFEALKKNGSNKTVDEVKNIFCLDDQRFERPVDAVGNEQYRAMAAVGYSFGKRVFCFPWFSRKRFEATHNNITWLFDALSEKDLIFILPLGK